MSKVIDKIDVKSGTGVFRHYENLNLSSWYLFAEYIDNAIGSYQKNKKKLKQLDANYQLKVEIIRDSSRKTITIRDNAAGIENSELERAFIIGERPRDTSGANEYGVGMKMASFHFTHKWSARTKAIGETDEKTIILDVDEIENRDSTIIDVIRTPVKKEKHGTEIYLEEFYDSNWPQGKSIAKIKIFLASIFRKYIDSGELDLRFDDGDIEEIITPRFPDILEMAYIGDPNYPDSEKKVWKEEVNFAQNTDTYTREITGWVGILELGQTGRKNSGIELVRRNRVIEGDELAWFPKQIYGFGHAEQRTRLFGELVFRGFSTNNNKSKIDWGTEDEGTEEKFIEYLKDLIVVDKDDDTTREFWDQLYNYIAVAKNETDKEKYSLEKQITEAHRDIQTRMQSDFSGYQPTNDENLENQEEDFLAENELPEQFELVISADENQDWRVVIIPNRGNGEGVWFKTTSVSTAMWPKEITIEWDINHKYSQLVFRPGEDIGAYKILAPEIFRLISIIVISQEQLRESGEEDIGIDYFASKLNSMLGRF